MSQQTQNYDEKHSETVAREKAAQTMKDLQQGNLPENKELIQGVDLMEEKLREVKPQLSRTGQKATKDVENILENTREIIEKKNQDHHLQKAYKHAHSAGMGLSYQERFGQLREMLRGTDTKELTTEARGNIQSLFTIIKLAFLSPEFRSTTNSFFTFFGDVISRKSEQGEQKLSKQGGSSEPEGYPEPKQGYEWVERDGTYSLQRSSKQEQGDGSSSSKRGLTKEQQEKLVDRMVDLLQTFHKHPEYSNSISYISQSIQKATQKATEGKQTMDRAAQKDAKKQQAAGVDQHKKQSKAEMRKFLENWIGEDYSFDSFTQSIVNFRRIIANDEELKKLFDDLRTFFTKSAQDASYVEQREKVREDARDLIQRTRFFLFDKYRDEFRSLKREISFLNRSIQHDETAEKLRENVQSLVDHLLMDSAGNPTLKPELLSDAQILLRTVFQTLKYIPLPPVRKETPNGGSFELDNLVVNCTDILPSQIHLGATMDAEKVNSNVLTLKVSKVRAHIQNAKFFIDKRDGFPKIKESGFLDVDIRGTDGMSIEIELEPERVSLDQNKTVDSLFRVRNANCSISKLKLRFRDTKHDGLYKFLGPVINMMARKRIETLVRDQIVETINTINRATAKATTQALQQTDTVKEKARELPNKAKQAKAKAQQLEKETRKEKSSSDKSSEPRATIDTTPITANSVPQGGTVDKTPITANSIPQGGTVDKTPITGGSSMLNHH